MPNCIETESPDAVPACCGRILSKFAIEFAPIDPVTPTKHANPMISQTGEVKSKLPMAAKYRPEMQDMQAIIFSSFREEIYFKARVLMLVKTKTENKLKANR